MNVFLSNWNRVSFQYLSTNLMRKQLVGSKLKLKLMFFWCFLDRVFQSQVGAV